MHCQCDAGHLQGEKRGTAICRNETAAKSRRNTRDGANRVNNDNCRRNHDEVFRKKAGKKTKYTTQTTTLEQALEREARLTPLKSLSVPHRPSIAGPKSCIASPSYNRSRPVLQEQRADSVFAGEAALLFNKHAKVRGSHHTTEPESASHGSSDETGGLTGRRCQLEITGVLLERRNTVVTRREHDASKTCSARTSG